MGLDILKVRNARNVNNMELLYKLKLNPDNPRYINEQDFERLKKSILSFGKMLVDRPIKYDENFVVWGGNQRLIAIKNLLGQGLLKDEDIDERWFSPMMGGYKDDKEKREFAIKDNSPQGISGGWDTDKLTGGEWDNLPLLDWGLDIEAWANGNGQELENEKDGLREDFSQKVGEVIYKPKQTNWKPEELFSIETKFDKEIENIKNEGLKQLFKLRTVYFATLNFVKIADYYAYQATPEEQKLFEKLGLIILDKDGLIENGFSELIDEEKNG